MKTRTRLSSLLLTALTLAVSAPVAMAHSDAPHMATLKATHGGQLGVAGSYSYELVVVKDAQEAADSPVVVYVTDHAGQKVATAGATGSVTILANKKKFAVTLQPEGDNRMKGSARYLSAPDMKVLVAITLAGKPPEQTRFTPLAAAKDGPMQ
jgi:hypothetical protein